MVYNFRGFLRFIYLWLTAPGWTCRRLAIVVAFALFYPIVTLCVWLGFFFDNIRFRRYRREPVEEPVFIVGNPRSGTTFLHRLLSRDGARFTTMQMWEILLAPSITQRKLIENLLAVAQQLGTWFDTRLERVEKGWRTKNVMHDVSFRKPEEDDYLLLHVWSALTIGLSAGLLEEAIAYTFFDTVLPESERRRIMSFYRNCVQRHLHAERIIREHPDRGYLAKNPALSPKVQTVREFFPDARFIYIVRNPLEVIPSYLNMMVFTWRTLGIPIKDRRLQTYLIAMARHWYRYPLDRLDRLPAEYAIIIKYDDLVNEPEKTVKKIYARFGYRLTPAFADVLASEGAQSRHYRSRHHYSLKTLGLSRELILAEFKFVFDRFGFDTSIGRD